MTVCPAIKEPAAREHQAVEDRDNCAAGRPLDESEYLLVLTSTSGGLPTAPAEHPRSRGAWLSSERCPDRAVGHVDVRSSVDQDRSYRVVVAARHPVQRGLSVLLSSPRSSRSAPASMINQATDGPFGKKPGQSVAT